jgi:hypothetical protein
MFADPARSLPASFATNPGASSSAPLVARRGLLGVAGLAGLGAVGGALSALEPPRTRRRVQGALDFEEFLAEAVPLAHDLVGDTSRIGQDRYLHALASLAACLTAVPIPEMRETTGDSPTRTFIGANECDAPFTVLHWRMEPGARLGAHPHIYGNVVTLLLEGEVRIENHEMVGTRDFDTKEPFPVRRVNDALLLPGAVNLVSLEHGYTHGFEAGPEGARGLDITTRIRERRETPKLLLAPEPLDAARRIYEGRWEY